MAGAVKLLPDRDRTAQIEQVAQTVADTFPGLSDPLDLGGTEQRCETGRVPRTHAVLIGTTQAISDGLPTLPGVANDLALMETTLVTHGLAKQQVHVLLNDRATHLELERVLAGILSDLGCLDSVLLFFSGHALDGDNLREFVEDRLGPPPDPVLRWPDQAFDQVQAVAPVLFLHGAGTQRMVLPAQTLSDAVLRLRNAGADVTVVLDTMFADTFALQERHARAGPGYAWSAILDRTGPVENAESQLLLPGAGQMSTLYAVHQGSSSVEFPLPKDAPDAKPYGLFTYKLATALHADGEISPRKLAQAMAGYQVEAPDSIGGSARWPIRHFFQSTDPDVSIIAEQRTGRDSDAIRILSPQPTRGAMDMQDPAIEIRGRVEWREPPMIVIVNKQEAELLPNGEFRHALRLDPGVTRVEVLAMTADSRQHRYAFEMRYKGAQEALLGDGTRYAVLIANQSYGGETGMAPLTTPFADIEALEAELTQTYGFTTQAKTAEGEELSLILRDATLRDMQILLHRISRIAGTGDTVLVYYAGHGDFESRTGNAYWVPSDAVAGVHGTYLSSDAVSDALKRIESNNLLLIADSCFSGGFRGEPGADEAPDADRLKRLSRMVGKRSRELISSGNLEVVQDQGGDGHSVFARALLNGLRNMEPKAFTASELYGRIHADVFSTAEQEPQNIKLFAAGHEGGGFVFVRAE